MRNYNCSISQAPEKESGLPGDITIFNEFGTRTYHCKTQFTSEQLANFTYVNPFTIKVLYTEFQLPVEIRVKDALFADIPQTANRWNDGMSSRSRHTRCLIYSKNNVYEFDRDLPMLVVTEESYDKNGKWSSTTYDFLLAAGYKMSVIRQDFSSGKYVNKFDSIEVMGDELRLIGCYPAAIQRYLMHSLHGAWYSYCELQEKLDLIADQGVQDTIEYVFNHARGTRRQGMRCLFINGAMWDFTEMPGVIIKNQTHFSGMGGGTTRYELIIDATFDLSECYEDDTNQPEFTNATPAVEEPASNGFFDHIKL